MHLELTDKPAAADLAFLEEQIIAFNMAAVNAYDGRNLAIFVHDAAQTIVAGISGYTWARFCEIQFLWVHADLLAHRRRQHSQRHHFADLIQCAIGVAG